MAGFAQTEEEIIAQSIEKEDISGACAVVLIQLLDRLFVANLGDSRVLLARKKVKESMLCKMGIVKTKGLQALESEERRKRKSLR